MFRNWRRHCGEEQREVVLASQLLDGRNEAAQTDEQLNEHLLEQDPSLFGRELRLVLLRSLVHFGQVEEQVEAFDQRGRHR